MEATERVNPSQRYLVLLIGVVSIAVAVTLLRAPMLGRRGASRVPAATAVPLQELSLRIEADGTITPPTGVVDKGARVVVSLTNASDKPIRVELPGYEDLIAPGDLQPGAVWRGEFRADRPGEDFAWLVSGRTAGRLIVKGSHLIEGHQ
jgi:hypothetical protein